MRCLSRSLIVLAVAAVAAASVHAQAPTTLTAAAPAKASGPRRSEFRVGGFMVSGERSFDFADTVQSATGKMQGIEVLMRAPAIGLFVRSLSGTFGTQPTVINLDARILLFPPSFTIFGGVGRRALYKEGVGNRLFDVVIAGISSTVNIGGTGLRTHVSGAVLAAKDHASKTTGAAALKDPSKGMEGEAAIFYRFPKVPVFATLGYRTEIFTGKSGGIEAPEEVRGLRIGGGIQFGGH